MPRKTPIPAPPADVFPDEPDVIAAQFTTDPVEPDEDPVIDSDDITALVPVEAIPPTHHLVVGMGTLAAMSEDEFQSKLDVMKRGQERIRTIQDQLLKKGEDYGTVRGIDRPFLHQPGAEKLANFYGFAVEQVAERLVGDGVTAPPLAYHVRSLVHLGDFSGPVVAQGYGESSSWEEKYRWRWAKAVCPRCGREGMVKGKKDGPLAGKWWCPQREGGCNARIEPGATNPDGSLQVKPPERIENTDPFSLAETILQMAAKRSLVASIRRATGTSGLFTQDEDSPSVRDQSAATPDDAPPPAVESAPVGIKVEPGAKSGEPTAIQFTRLKKVARERGVGPEKMSDLLGRLFDVEVDPDGKAVSEAVKKLNAIQLGQLIRVVETGELPYDGDDEVARATLPDDIGAK